MLKSLVSSKCINFERLLVLKAKELGLDGNECHILLLIYALKEASVRLITRAMLQNYPLLSTHDLNKVLQSILSKKFIYNRSGAISLNHLEERLLQEKNEEEPEEAISLVSIFEEQFGRALSPIELNILREWKESN